MTQNRLKALLTYDHCSGKFFWNNDLINGVKKGDEAGTLITKGYIHICLDQKTYKAHRLVWLYVFGVWPKDQIDHINQIKTDNRVENLREVNNRTNHKNSPLQINNRSGAIGVSYHKATKKWKSSIKVKGDLIHLGLFSDIDEAIKTRKEAEIKFNFHPNHGKKHR